VYAVPKIIVNDKVEFEGALPEDQFIAQVLKAVERNN
ncbi:MAG: glutaredoxin, partial [Caldiserica bacterium]